MEVSKDRITVLAETAEIASEIDIERARLARSKAEKALNSADLEQREHARHQLKLQRSLIRLQLADDDLSAAAENKDH